MKEEKEEAVKQGHSPKPFSHSLLSPLCENMKLQLALQFATLNCLSDLCVNSSEMAPILVKITSSATQLQTKKRWRQRLVNANSRRSSEEHSKDISSRNLIQYLLGRMNAMEHSAFTFEESSFFSPTQGVVMVTTTAIA